MQQDKKREREKEKKKNQRVGVAPLAVSGKKKHCESKLNKKDT